MSSKTPIRAVFNDSNVATGLAEYQSGEFIPLTHGGLGASLSIGSAGQVLKVNSGGSALEFGAVEAIVNIDNASDLTSNTLAASDLLLVSDGGTEGRATLSQIQTAIKDTTATLTNKTISGSSNTLSNIGNSSLTNSAITIGTTSISLGASNTTIAGISNLTAGGINITGNSITSADSSIIEMGEGLSVTGNLTVSGNMTVSGTTTTLETTNSVISDKLIELANGTSGTPSGDIGIVGERGSSNNTFIGFDESADEFTVGTGTFTGASSGDLSITKGTFSSAANRIYNGSNYVALVSPSLGGANVTLTLPANDGDTNQVLITDGSGNLSFSSVSAASGAGLSNVVEDTTPQLGGNLDVQTNNIVSTSNRSISILPNGSGVVKLDGDGSSGGVSVSDGLIDIRTGTGNVAKVKFYCESSNAHAQTLQAAPHSAGSSAVLVLPTASGTLVGTGDTGSVSNTMLSNSSITIGDDSSTNFSVDLGGSFEIIGGSGITTAITNNRITLSTDGSIVTETSSDTLTNKTINSNANTLHIDLDDLGTFTGTLAEFNAGLQGDSFVSLTGTETLTNKTLTSPKINEDVAVTSTATEINLLDGVTATTAELNFTDGVTSNIQTQLDTKASNAFAIAQAVALG